MPCRVCQIEYGSKEDDDLGFDWVRCGVNHCKYWVHAGCICVQYDGIAQLEAWARNHVRCPKHIRKPNSDDDDDTNFNGKKVAKKGERLREAISRVKKH